jgi:hypothetical protein
MGVSIAETCSTSRAHLRRIEFTRLGRRRLDATQRFGMEHRRHGMLVGRRDRCQPYAASAAAEHEFGDVEDRVDARFPGIGDRGEAHQTRPEQVDLVLDTGRLGDRRPGTREFGEPFGTARADAHRPSEADQPGGVADPARERRRREQLEGLLDSGRQTGLEREARTRIDVVDEAGGYVQTRGSGEDVGGAVCRSHVASILDEDPLSIRRLGDAGNGECGYLHIRARVRAGIRIRRLCGGVETMRA